MNKQSLSLSGLLPKTKCNFVWRDFTLTETDWGSTNTYDLSLDLSFEKALAVLSEDLSFYEKLNLSEVISNFEHYTFDQKKFFEEAKYTRFDLIEKIQTLSKKLPNNFLSWCASKKLNLKDFRAFLNDYQKGPDFSFFSKIADLDPTKNTGLQIIEFYFDLRAQKKISPKDLSSFNNSEILLTSLKKKRFSTSLSKDQAILDQLSKVKLVPGVKASLKRNGDKRQIKLEIEADSPDMLYGKLEKSLERTKSLNDAWNAGQKK